MTQKKISDLAVAGTLGFGDLVPVVQGGVTEKATLEQVRRFIGARVTLTNTITGVDMNPVTWSAADFDTDSFWSSNSKTALTIPFSGFYAIGVHYIPSSTNGNAAIFLRKNGSSHVAHNYTAAANGRFTLRHVDRCNPNDFFESLWDFVAGTTILCHTGFYMTAEFLGR